MQAFKSIELAKRIYDKLLGELAKKNDLTLNELRILMFLKNSSGTNIAKDIVDGLGATKSHISMSISDLEEKKYIIKSQDDKDKKKSHLELTEKSFKVIEEGASVQQKVKDIMFDGISEKDIDTLRSICNKMMNNLEKYNKEV